ncbi:DUF3039 domain-containing protein [Paenarthrobacter sp. NPDC057355]|uniref:DUF3039 domain-containing protein n=1 Tax=Paenarthrobacter sp. NPDC057355 TaxID=3346105 RepID=UPI0036384F07
MQTNTQARPKTAREAVYPPVILHYVLKAQIAESAVLGNAMNALCGIEWSADATNYGATANPSQSKAVICPMCADIYSSLPAESHR